MAAAGEACYSPTMTVVPSLRIERLGRLGRITLDRPDALNALDHDMILGIHAALDRWAGDDGIDFVVLRGEGRAFCAGGDLKTVVEPGRDGDEPRLAAVFGDEYRLDWAIHCYGKPIISFLDGIVMGGGAGISIHGSHRVATARTLFAMPEVTIGFHPDTGASWYLSQLPGAAGRYLALTGSRIGPADCLDLGLATHYLAADRWPAVEQALSEGSRGGDAHAKVDEVLGAWAEDPPVPPALDRADIDAVFGAPSLSAVAAALAEARGSWADKARRALAGASPTSLAVTFRQLELAAQSGLREALSSEFRLSLRLAVRNDFRQGVRAALVDRDRPPQWHPAMVEGIDAEYVESFFRPVGAGQELVLS